MNLALISYAFRDTLVIKHNSQTNEPPNAEVNIEQNDTAADVSRSKSAMVLIKSSLKTPSVWLLSMFYFFYVGSQITSNGWVVEYLVDVRGGDLSQMGYVPAGFNGGCLIGRLLLAEPTHRFGEKRMVFFYCCLAIILQVIFWL